MRMRARSSAVAACLFLCLAACHSAAPEDCLDPDERMSIARAFNNESVLYLRDSVQATNSGQTDAAETFLRNALESAGCAIRYSARDERGQRGSARAWANQAYALWRLGRVEEARASALEARRVDSAYVFHRRFLEEMASAGQAIPVLESAVDDDATRQP